jgi:hypothetical protein
MELLERAAKIEYGAKWITLDTVAYFCEWVEGENGGQGWFEEHIGRVGKTVGWYKRRGYEEYRVSSAGS